MTESRDPRDLLDLERDLPTSQEDIDVLHRLNRTPTVTDPADANRLRDPFWSFEKALEARFFNDDDEPFEL